MCIAVLSGNGDNDISTQSSDRICFLGDSEGQEFTYIFSGSSGEIQRLAEQQHGHFL